MSSEPENTPARNPVGDVQALLDHCYAAQNILHNQESLSWNQSLFLSRLTVFLEDEEERLYDLKESTSEEIPDLLPLTRS